MYHGQHKSSDVPADVIVKFVEERLKITYSRYNERLFSSLGTWLLLCWREITKDEDSADREGARRVKREEVCVSFSLGRTSRISLPIFQLSQMQCKQFLRFWFDLHFNKKINDKKLTRRLDELISVLQIINIYCGFL